MRLDRQKSLERGEIMEAVMFLIFLLIVIFVFVIPAKNGPIQTKSSLSLGLGGTSGNTYTDTSATGPSKKSTYSGGVTISTGNAAYAIQSYEEYITLYNYSGASVDITGWTLKNARGERTYNVNGVLQQFPSTSVRIPQGSPFVSPTGTNTLTDIILNPGEQAMIVTGSITNTSPFPIVSFKENKCSGYLQDQYTYSYSFSPSLSTSCIQPSAEPGAGGLDRGCQDLLTRTQSCQTAKINTVDAQGHTTDYRGQTCNGCINGVGGLTNACTTFIQSHLSYQGCLQNHAGDANFYGTTWRVYLKQPLELWAKDHETIYLYDRSGNLVDYKTY